MKLPAITIVIPTVGRETLVALVADLALIEEVSEVLVVDDRPTGISPLGIPHSVRALATEGGQGPAAARNLGWRAAETEWVVFLDDDIVLTPGWPAALMVDLETCEQDVGGCQGTLEVPVTDSPTDWARNVAALSTAKWITADMAYRRAALSEVGGFDERFRRAYREDTDLALRVTNAGWSIRMGSRRSIHPVRPAPWWISVSQQRGNADDALMYRLHGLHWRRRTGEGRGRFRQHLLTTAALLVALITGTSGRRRASVASWLAWTLATIRFASTRMAPGPKTLSEVMAMAFTSVAIPPLAVMWRLSGYLPRRGPGNGPTLEAVLFDRDGTLIRDVPYNGDPDAVQVLDGVTEVFDDLRARGLKLAMVTNQSGIGRGLITAQEVDAVNQKVADLLGGFDTIVICPHHPDAECGCRKPAPGMVVEAARNMGVAAQQCAMVGDILDDVSAALRAGARAILVPNRDTRPSELETAPVVAGDLRAAADILAGWRKS